MRAVWTVVLVRAIHLAMNISESRRLISLYKEFKCLWDPKDSNYTNRGVRDDAWRQISCEMGNKSIENLKKKMRSLAGGYRREKHREKQSRITGSGAQDTYKSKWFAYDDFDFMADKNEPGTTRDTLEHVESDTTEGELEVNTTVSENENSNITSDTQPERANHHTDQSREQNDQNAQSSVQTTNKRTKKRKKTTSNNADDISDETLSEAFQLLQQCAQPPQPETDSYIAFGQYISTELRKYDAVTLVNVKNAICQVIFQADTGRYGDSNYGYYTNSYPGTPIASTSSQSQSLQPQNYPAPIPQTSPSAHLASNSSQSQFLKPQDYSLPQSPPN
ncbi:uncharacterized protein LOC128199379 [Bicyclus anynana]|uniref:Uncharacterized protein LOC112049822 n=1 Tax=Bicyclus anynana TaxID=110368 RepID=A0A6J1N9Q5_BICAN|nr:uncharacterized protein LOC112049822 [Bicyclus anynana]XP_023951997.2 uncharacterized protein LOC112055934 isoform X2 [Bicyclus anynana]XP_023952992.1 uncharacterized protein LOC112056748 [Bicyclus anynana]XP_023953340.2 uncharacterized protein LOC112057079 [Bicyclus anynana]XP_052744638.1 uncharacterized protein LOC128199379 [Bicyclus anynana]